MNESSLFVNIGAFADVAELVDAVDLESIG